MREGGADVGHPEHVDEKLRQLVGTRAVAVDGRDEVGQMAAAFNAMQAGYQRVIGTVGQVASELNSGTRDMAERMSAVRQGMLSQQSETDQAATAINEMSATVQHIAEHAGTTRDQSQSADQLARAGQHVVERDEEDRAIAVRPTTPTGDRDEEEAAGKASTSASFEEPVKGADSEK